MEIKCWGSRGSIPVSGDQYLRYGGDTTCIEITARTGQSIIVDAGTGIRELGNSFIDRNITSYHLLFTHAHWDHILGFAFFRPLQYRQATLVIQERNFSRHVTSDILGQVMRAPFFPIGLNDLKADIQFDKSLNNRFAIGSVQVETIGTSHTGGGLGYRFTEDQSSFVFLTDNELGFSHPGGRSFDDYVDFSRDADLLFHDSEYTADEYKRKLSWGHSSVQDVLKLALKANVRQVGLFHINQDRTDDQMDAIVARCTAALRQKSSALACFAVPCLFQIRL